METLTSSDLKPHWWHKAYKPWPQTTLVAQCVYSYLLQLIVIKREPHRKVNSVCTFCTTGYMLCQWCTMWKRHCVAFCIHKIIHYQLVFQNTSSCYYYRFETSHDEYTGLTATDLPNTTMKTCAWLLPIYYTPHRIHALDFYRFANPRSNTCAWLLPIGYIPKRIHAFDCYRIATHHNDHTHQTATDLLSQQWTYGLDLATANINFIAVTWVMRTMTTLREPRTHAPYQDSFFSRTRTGELKKPNICQILLKYLTFWPLLI